MKKPEYLHDGDFAVTVLGRNEAQRQHFYVAEHEDVHEEAHGSMNPSADDWRTVVMSTNNPAMRLEQWFAECTLWGHETLQGAVEVDPKRRGGIPVLKGTRFTVGQTLAELADSSGVPEVAERFDLDEETIRRLLSGLALLVERPCR